jgi:hypothetical protein
MKKLVLETTAPFQGLPELVAYDEGLFAKEGLEIAALKVEELRASRLVVCDPAPIPLDELQRTYDWLKSWGMLEETASPMQLVNLQVATHAHQAAE